MIGNTRLHWGWFRDTFLEGVWHTGHLIKDISPDDAPDFLPEILARLLRRETRVLIASVVDKQTQLWGGYQAVREITLKDVNLAGLYKGMGIDRALALWGGASTHGYPCLVIDAGTALTITGVDAQKVLVGGAILPGLRTQFDSLSQKTAALPSISLPHNLPSLWATNTGGAMEAGIIYSVLGGVSYHVREWLARFPDSAVIITGGDGEYLERYLREYDRALASKIILDDKVIFWGTLQCLLD
ncbi:MAG: pantothenate kinase [Chlorogloea purpurea SAG 13.99]|nr:pantothenate kinase [Chlorogloea purpurea SAG 13.99]